MSGTKHGASSEGGEATRKGLMLILSSPSGAGKSSLTQELCHRDHDLHFSVSHTTRTPRQGETDGQDYHFVTRAQFECMVEEGAFLEWAEVFGNLYGSSRAAVEGVVASGRDVIFDIDWQGAMQIRKSPLSHLSIAVLILPPSMAELQRRLEARGKDTPETIARRMAGSLNEIGHWQVYDHVLVNDDFGITLNRLCHILEAGRLQRERQPGIAVHIDRLRREFEQAGGDQGAALPA